MFDGLLWIYYFIANIKMTKRTYSISSLLVISGLYVTVIKFIVLPLWGQILLFLVCIIGYVLILSEVFRYKVSQIKKSFNPPGLWSTVSRLYGKINAAINGLLLEISVAMSARKGAFFIHYSSDKNKFIRYLTFDLPDFPLTDKLTWWEGDGPDDPTIGSYTMAYRNESEPICFIEICTSVKLVPEKLAELETIIAEYKNAFKSIHEYANQMTIEI
jgi:hypothetical protein